MQVFIL